MSDEKNQEVTGEAALLAELEALKAENESLKTKQKFAPPPRKLTCRPSKAGAMSAYGMGRYPVTLYRSQWLFLLDNIQSVRDNLEAFHKAGVLKDKE